MPMHRCEFERTTTGILIGGAYTRPPPPMTDGAEALQRALLAREVGERKHRGFWIGLGVAVLGFIGLVVL